MEEERNLIKQLGEKVGARAQAVEKLEVEQKIKQSKKDKLIQQAKRLAKNEEMVRKKV